MTLEIEVVETKVETKPEVVGIETELNNDADDDEVKEHDGGIEFSDHSENDPDYVYVSPKDDGQSSDTLADSYQSKEFQSLPNSDDEGDSNSKIVYLTTILEVVLDKCIWRLGWSLILSNYLLKL